MPFLQGNDQLQQLLNSFVDPNRFAATFDNALARQLAEQKNANELFQTLARTNPALAEFVTSQPGVVESLTKTPRTFGPAPGAPLAEATRKYKPSGAAGGKPTTMSAAGGYVNKIAQGYQTAFKKPMPPGAVKKMSEIVASGRFPDAAELGMTDEEMSAAASASGDAAIPLTTEVYRGLVGAEEKKSGKPLSEEQKADIFLRLTTGRSQDVRDMMTQMTIGRMQDAAKIAELQTSFMQMRNETLRDRPMSKNELVAAQTSHDTAVNNAAILTKVANSLSSITPDNPTAFTALVGQLRQIQGKDPAAVAVRDAVMSLATLVTSNDPAQRTQQLSALRGVLLSARDHFNTIASMEAEALKTRSKKPAPPAEEPAADEDESEDTDEVDDIMNEYEQP